METRIVHSELIQKKEKIQSVSVELKKRFIGLDSVIDEITSLMMPWYLFPEAQLRPTVINLWGLTGSGKTALIQGIIELLDYKNLYSHLDMGEFEQGSSSWVKDIFTDDLEYFHQKPAIICMDEFQFAKTIDGERRELGRDKLRVIWEILDSGKINYIPNNSTYYLSRADACLMRLEKAIANGIELFNGIIVGDESLFLLLFNNFYFDEYHRYNEPLSRDYFISRDFVEGLFNLFDQSPFTKDQLRERLRSLSLRELKNLIVEAMKTRTATRQLDLSHALIFVLGNLDEAYSMSNNLNPDISADEFHEATSKITVASIKQALRKRFRNEQIARLGNNHIIYKSFKKADFMELINRELARVSRFVKDSFQWNILFDSTVTDVVYAEGVFPAQGTRPVFTTIKNLIESRISKMVMAVIEKSVPAETITWLYQNETFVFVIQNAKGEVIDSFRDEVHLKIDHLRKPRSKNLQAHTAVHEAGHAVLAALTLRIVPSVVVSKTASAEGEGFCLVNFPDGPMTKESIKKDIIISLGGYVAEKMIFGEEYTSSGVSLDIETATELANKAIRKYAMGSDPILISVESAGTEDHFYNEEKYAMEAVSMIKSCLQQAEEILERNQLLLLKMSDYLTTHSRMEEKSIAEFVQQYSTEDWVLLTGFVKKEEYYDFYTDIQTQMEKLEKKAIKDFELTMVCES